MDTTRPAPPSYWLEIALAVLGSVVGILGALIGR